MPSGNFHYYLCAKLNADAMCQIMKSSIVTLFRSAETPKSFLQRYLRDANLFPGTRLQYFTNFKSEKVLES